MNIPEGWPTDEMVDAGFDNLPWGSGSLISWRDVQRSLKFALAAAPQEPAQEEKPVAWMHTSRENSSEGQDEPSYFDYTYIHRNKELAAKGKGHIPLYTRPDNSNLRKAAGEALKLLDKLGSGPTIENLRAALEGE